MFEFFKHAFWTSSRAQFLYSSHAKVFDSFSGLHFLNIGKVLMHSKKKITRGILKWSLKRVLGGRTKIEAL